MTTGCGAVLLALCVGLIASAPAQRRQDRKAKKAAAKKNRGSGTALIRRRCPTARTAWSPTRRTTSSSRPTRSARASPSPRRRRRSISSTSPARPTRASPGRTGATAWRSTASTTPRIGDHLARRRRQRLRLRVRPGRRRQFRQLVDLRKLLNLPEGHYTPGKIHGRLDMGDDGWLYFSTHRGSTTRHHRRVPLQGRLDPPRAIPETGKTEVVVQGPVPKHCIPNSVLDPKRLIFYGGTAAGTDGDERGHPVLRLRREEPEAALLRPGRPGALHDLRQVDRPRLLRRRARAATAADALRPGQGRTARRRSPATIGMRAATQETPQGIVYTVSHGPGRREARRSTPSTPRPRRSRSSARPRSARPGYIASIDADPTGPLPLLHSRRPRRQRARRLRRSCSST